MLLIKPPGLHSGRAAKMWINSLNSKQVSLPFSAYLYKTNLLAMRFIILGFMCLMACTSLVAQSFAFQRTSLALDKTANASKHRTKPVIYTTMGYNVQLNKPDIVIGGTTMAYKKFGTFLAYKVGIQNLMMPLNGERGIHNYDNVKQNVAGQQIGTARKWSITGNEQRSATFMLSGGITIPVTKRIPVYFGAGFTRYRAMFEYTTPFDSTNLWNVNPGRTGFEMNYTAGVGLPLGRFLINVGYDHNPQSVFIGIGIGGKYVYEDVDEWWWGANKR